MRKLNSIEFRIPWQRLPEAPPRVHRLLRHLQILLQGRMRPFFLVDGILVLFATSQTLAGEGEPGSLFRAIVIVPNLLLLVPILASLIDLERQSGTLELALSVQSTEGYFLRRALALCAVLFLQSAILILLIDHPRPISNLMAIGYSLLVTVTTAAIVVFWAVRLRGSGAVMVASYATVLLLGKWIFFQPFPPRFEPGRPDDVLGLPLHTTLYLWNCLVLALATLLLYLYARRRIRRPQSIL